MTADQHKLIYKTIGTLAYLCFLGVAGLVIHAIHWAITTGKSALDFIKALLSIGDGGILLYPLITAGAIFIWIRTFIKLGSDTEQ